MRMKQSREWAGTIVETSCLAWVWGLGVWTLFCNSVVLRQGSFAMLLRLSPIAISLAIAGFWVTRHRIIPTKSLGEGSPDTRVLPIGREVALPVAIAVFVTILYGITDNFALFWCLTTLVLGFSYWRSRPQSPHDFVLPLPAKGSGVWLLGLAAIAIVATAVIYRTHGDDAFYLNLMVAALDRPDEPLMVRDSMHGLPDLPLLLPVYRVHSIELLGAAISYLTGISHLWVRNFWQPLAIAPLVVFASALYLRVIVPRHWLTVTTVTTLLLVVLTTAAGLGNFSLARLQQGKPLFVAILVPIIIAYTLRYLAEPTIWRWLILSLANIAAIGCSSTALYAAPLTVLLTTCGYWSGNWKATFRSLWALTTTIYPLAIALTFASQVKQSSPNMSNLQFEPVVNNDFVLHLHHGMGGYIFWVAVLAGWAVVGDRQMRRVLLGIIFAFMLVFLNPFLQEFWAVNLTGVPTYRRLWWVIPRHLLLAILLSFPILAYPFTRYKNYAKIILCAVVISSITVLSTMLSPNIYSPQIDFNRVHFRFPPQLKLPNSRLQTIKRMEDIIPSGSYVLAPASPVGDEVAGDELARWLIVNRTPLYPIVVTESYLQITNFFSPLEVEQRRRLSQYISGVHRGENAPQLLQTLIPQLSVGAIIVPLSNPWESEIHGILTSLGYEMNVIDFYAVWVLPVDKG
ncbi:DUF6077 domain-containing protein [Roseofilum casamattae]|uniref:DUF6077 domain-containing protein n=1 Tax=Roseofilum casamattae BLCC-M143 TaxID=3022442 RepID=A0ABT7C002_9CYAN|nr:DUF6077 domain-containing protein [Roseofilum casamattae]MDJ1184780.1 DUF6077 domain-containing protein [Roseofilum casamattae BLCC-M143]